VEYALELVKRGAISVGILSSEGVVLSVNEKPESKLENPSLNKKIFQIDDHVGTAIAGLSSDARVLVDQARIYCQRNKLLYDEPAQMRTLVSDLGYQIQKNTQHGGIRPFGVSMLFAGIDLSGSRIILIDPTGTFKGFKAKALGKNSVEADSFLEKKYEENMTLDDIIDLSIKTIKTTSDEKIVESEIKTAIIPSETRIFKRLH
jgi:proteasome alpha subunit